MKNKSDCYDVELIKKELRRLKIPKEYFNFNVEKINSHDISIIMSIRKDSGKTTQALLIGMILNYLYEYEIEYLRCDRDQTTAANVDNIFDVIVKYGYIDKIFRGRWNNIEYKGQSKRFYLTKTDEEGNIIDRSKRPICLIHSLQDHKKMKSIYNNVNGNWLVFDEIFDTSRDTSSMIVELADQISTITRERPEARVVMLGNNMNRYSFWFEEFDLMYDIDNLNFGGMIDKTTEYGTTIFCTLLEVSKQKKENVLKRKIRFFGINNPKLAAFTGLQAFAGNQWQHINSKDKLDPEYLLWDRLYIYHRGRWVKLKYFYNGKQEYIFLHYSNEPKLDDNIILTQYPELNSDQYLYGFGKDCRSDRLRNILTRIRGLRDVNKWYYSSNSVGDLVEDYLKSVR